MTGMGVVLGTAVYMSPEQAKGKPVDRRADIWAFGVVLAEMLSGRTVFAGESVTETLASVMKDTPVIPDAPAAIRHLMRRCLERDPRQRLRDIGEARVVLEDPAAAEPEHVSEAPLAQTHMSRRPWAWVAAIATASIAAWRCRVGASAGTRRGCVTASQVHASSRWPAVRAVQRAAAVPRRHQAGCTSVVADCFCGT